jgi:hypothetical protein
MNRLRASGRSVVGYRKAAEWSHNHIRAGNLGSAQPSGSSGKPSEAEVGSDVLNRSGWESSFQARRGAGWPWLQARRWTSIPLLQTTRKLIGGNGFVPSARAQALLTAYRTGTSPALTKGRPGGKLPSGNRAERSPAFRCSAASRNAATKSRAEPGLRFQAPEPS